MAAAGSNQEQAPASGTDSSARAAGGSCLCGGVAFSAALPSKWIAHCHCSRCRRAHGAAFVTWVSVPAERAVITDPDRLLHWYGSPPGGERAFCSRCGSPMFFRSGTWAGELHIARALFTDPLDREPQVHAYYDTHVPWVHLADALPKKGDPAATPPSSS
jgi:hypothetical protein